jgi:hypothetical protein
MGDFSMGGSTRLALSGLEDYSPKAKARRNGKRGSWGGYRSSGRRSLEVDFCSINGSVLTQIGRAASI